MSPHSPAQLQAAIESLSRTRTLELPPDSSGGRTLFHRGEGADLATRVDKDGKVQRHELFFFGHYLKWSAQGIVSGAAPTGTVEELIARGDGPAPNVTLDADANLTAHRTAQVASALAELLTEDPVLEHLKRAIADGAMANVAVTRTEHAVNLEVLRNEAEESQRRELARRKQAQSAVLWVFAVALALAFGSITVWILTR